MLAATPVLFDPLTLPCGLRLENRIVKAAMEENLSSRDYVPDGALFTLYRRWSRGGAGLLLTGNVMVDHRALTGPGGVVLEAETGLAPFREWAAAAKSGGATVVMQISHPGRQIYAGLGMLAIVPSSVPLEMGRFSSMFERPVEITPEQIKDIIGRFVATAVAAERAGFDGVQIHAAHGYLVSQFLSPLANRRTDVWGGSLENRARFLLRIVDGVRAAVGPGFAVAVKLNSADFQRGGFDADDARTVVAMLNERAIDFMELSGGSYESPAMQGTTADARTLARKAFFLEFAVAMLAAACTPLMVTGSISRRETAERVIASGVAVAGVGTPFAFEPDLPTHWREAERHIAPPPELRLKSKALRALARMNSVAGAIRQLSAGNALRTRSSLLALMQGQVMRLQLSRTYRVWRKTQTALPYESVQQSVLLNAQVDINIKALRNNLRRTNRPRTSIV